MCQRWISAGLIGVALGWSTIASSAIELVSRIEGQPQVVNLPNAAPSSGGSHSADGRFVAFVSAAKNLVAEPEITFDNVFLYDRETGSTELLTTGANGFSSSALISGDGRAVVFTSFASNLVAGDDNESTDVFVYDRDTGTTELISAGAQSGGFSAAISGDGRFVSFSSRSPDLVAGDTNGTGTDIFLHDRETGTTTLVTEGGNLASNSSSINWDGRFVAFHSTANNLVNEDVNNATDIFVYDRVSDSIERLTAGANLRSRFASISGDGRFVAFESNSTNLVDDDSNGSLEDIFVHDRDTDTTVRLTTGGGNPSTSAEISSDGQFVVFSSMARGLVGGDSSRFLEDIFCFDRSTGTLERITNSANAPSRTPLVSGDGRFVSFFTEADNLVAGDFQNGPGVVVYERATENFDFLPAQSIPFEVAGGDDASGASSVSGDGRFIAYESSANNLLASDSNDHSDIFVYDRTTGSTEQLTINADMGSFNPSISEDGRFVAFESNATNLVVGDTNGQRDIFVHDRETSTTQLLTAGGNGDSTDPAISGDGQFVTFVSAATNLVTDNTFNTQSGIYLFDRESNSTQLITERNGGFNFQPTINRDGRFVAFSSDGDFPTGSSNGSIVLNIIVYDRLTNTFEALTAGEMSFDQSFSPSISADGRFVAFVSGANNLGVGDNGATTIQDVFLHDRDTSTTTILTPNGVISTFTAPSVSADGRFVSFSTPDFTLLPAEDLNIFEDVLLYDRATDSLALISREADGTPGNGASLDPSISSDGRVIAFTSSASTFANNGTIAIPDVFAFTASELPTADSLTINTNEDTPVTITVTGFDPESDPLTFTIETPPGNGDISGAAPNFVYTPNPNFFGTDSFTFSASDDIGPGEPATVSITVIGVNDAPFALGTGAGVTELVVAQNVPTEIILAGSDVDGDPLAYTITSGPTNGALSGTAPDLIYTPDANFSGTDSFTFTVSDGEGASAPVTVTISVEDTVVALFSAVLPTSRSVRVDTTATAFGTLINAGTADALDCTLQPPDTLAAGFFYQSTDPTTNEPRGEPNVPVNIAAGTAQSFIFGLSPSAEQPATNVAIVFQCANAVAAPSIVGLNTLLLSASIAPVPDLIALGATDTGDGVMRMSNNIGFFTAATINVGSAASIVVSADTGEASLPTSLSLCQTDPVTSVCINPTAPTTGPVMVEIEANDTPTFAVFATASEAIALDPANNRVFLRFTDELNEVRGATSVAVENEQ